ncbi:MAG TPA: hypothetical protein PLN21_03170 [Gemmatales bacterium]|nr:hypothetical protein [Gemmatales bacterium]
MRLGRTGMIVSTTLLAIIWMASLHAQPPATSSVHREGFEQGTICWRTGVADAPFQETLHRLDSKIAHTGTRSENIQLIAKPGTHIYYWYALPKAEIVDDLKVSVWVKANRPGMRVGARVVLPQERNAKNLDQHVTLLLTGDVYAQTGDWQQLWLRDPKKELSGQSLLMQGEVNHKVNTDGAFIDQLQLNIYSGPGEHQVWIDDIEINPVISSNPVETRPTTPANTTSIRNAAPLVELTRNKLVVEKQNYFLRGIRLTDAASLKSLREIGFNTLWVDSKTPEATLTSAVKEGFWLVPELRPPEGGMAMLTPTSLRTEMDRFPRTDHVLAWQLSGNTGLTSEQVDVVSKSLRGSRTQGQLYSGSVWNGYRQYSQQLEMIGVHRWPLLTTLNPTDYRDWLVSRTRLAQPDAFFWTWVQTHVPEGTRVMVHGVEKSKTSSDLGPNPGQIRLMSYLALSAGYRGLGFWADDTLNDEKLGKARKLELALLNLQFSLLEPYLATIQDVQWIKTTDPRIHAAILRCDGGFVVLPIWTAPGNQFVLGPSHVKHFQIVIPGVPVDAQVFEVVPGDLRSIHHRRAPGGVEISLPDFAICTALLCTSDTNAIGKMQQQAQQTARLAAQWAYDAAREELTTVEVIHDQLKAQGLDRPYDHQLREQAYKQLEASFKAFNRGNLADHRLSYEASQRSGEYIRQLMRNHWDYTVKGLSSPVSSQYTLSYYSLPKYYDWLKVINQSQISGNLLRDGDCETPTGAAPSGWTVKKDTQDEVQLTEMRVSESPHDGSQCWKLSITPKDPSYAPDALERTFLVVSTPNVTLPPGTNVKLTGWYRIPVPIRASADGLLLYDSAGGESLGIRLYHSAAWKKIEVFRKVPASGQISMSIALTGIGTVYFDDLKIESINASPPATTSTPVK